MAITEGFMRTARWYNTRRVRLLAALLVVIAGGTWWKVYHLIDDGYCIPKRRHLSEREFFEKAFEFANLAKGSFRTFVDKKRGKEVTYKNLDAFLQAFPNCCAISRAHRGEVPTRWYARSVKMKYIRKFIMEDGSIREIPYNGSIEVSICGNETPEWR
jgi:hypothetical protein